MAYIGIIFQAKKKVS